MSLNCKPGDLAVIVRGCCAGCIVEVLAPYDGRGYERHAAWWIVSRTGMPTSNIGVPCKPGERVHCDDSYLRPILPPPNTITSKEVKELYDAPPVKQKERTAINADLTSASGETVPGVAK